MLDEQDQMPVNVDNEEALVENEAIKNTERIAEEKKARDTNTGEDLPGYPHYAPEEDVLNPSSDLEIVDVDVEKIARGGNISGDDLQSAPATQPGSDMELPLDTDDEEDLEIVPGTEADVTKEDLLLLGPKDQDMDLGEDEELQNAGFPLSQTGDDLDVPGEELDDANEELGEEDEENNYYSLGGDNHEDLEDPA